MILVTVGSQAPFDRLIRAVDQWAKLRDRSDVFAQIAETSYIPKHIDFTAFVGPSEFKSLARQADIIVAHAGMGSIISALELGKPIVVMPRRGHLRETRNDHQVAAAKQFGNQGRVIVAQDEVEIPKKIDIAVTLGETDRIGAQASSELLSTIRSFIDGGSGLLTRPHGNVLAATEV
jgi:UDP-N-acetylglucosamine transferase subunit ALG13